MKFMLPSLHTHSKLLLACLLVLAMSACSSAEERARIRSQHEIETCTQRGLDPESEAFIACRMTERDKERKRREARINFDDDFRPPQPALQSFRW
jgi:uncharacterized lipoprotein